MYAVVVAVDQALEDEEIHAEEFMYELNDDLRRRQNLDAEAAWEYETNITDETVRKKNEVAAENAKFLKVSTIVRVCNRVLSAIASAVFLVSHR